MAIVTVSVGAVSGIVVALIQRPFKAKTANAQAETAQAATKSAEAATKSAVAIEEVRAQTLNNGGSSLRDALDRIDRRTEAVDHRVTTMDERQLSMERWAMGFDQAVRTMGSRIDHLTEKAHAMAENQGAMITEIQTMKKALYGAEEPTPPSEGDSEKSS